MSSSSHTPGPWYGAHMADDSTSCNCRYIFGGDYMGSIAVVSVLENEGTPETNDSPPLEEAKANANLIAAAPELLAELEGMLQFVEDDNLEGSEIMVGPCWCLKLKDDRIPGPCGFCHLSRVRALIAKARSES